MFIEQVLVLHPTATSLSWNGTSPVSLFLPVRAQASHVKSAGTTTATAIPMRGIATAGMTRTE